MGEVDVMLTLFSSSEKVLRVDKERSRSATSETDSSGGTRQQADESLRESTVLAGSSGSGEPVVEKELAPEIAGIVISAQEEEMRRYRRKFRKRCRHYSDCRHIK